MYSYIYSYRRRKASQFTIPAMALAILVNAIAYYCSSGPGSLIVPLINMPLAKIIFIGSIGVSIGTTFLMSYCYRRKYQAAVNICAVVLIYQPFIIFFAAMQ